MGWTRFRFFRTAAVPAAFCGRDARGPAFIASALVISAAVCFAGPACAAEVKVLSAGALRSTIQEVAAEFEKATGNQVTIGYATAGAVEQKIEAGEPVDVALLTKPRLEKLAQSGKIAAGSVTVLGRSPIALAVKAGAPKPDISSVEAVKQTLLRAKSIAYTDPASGGTSGIHFAKELERLGIAGEVAAKTRPIKSVGGAPPAVGEAIAKGEAELGFQPISELKAVPGIDIVGPLPAEMQTPELTYAAGLSAAAPDPDAAKALIAFLAGPKTAEIVKAKGLLPGDGR
jgi:molybdate transport system substrate-binding protein